MHATYFSSFDSFSLIHAMANFSCNALKNVGRYFLNQNPLKQGNVATKSNNPGGTIGGECYDYRCGFCINGPHCKYKHVRRSPEDIETLRLPQWYFKKIKSVFT